MLKNTIGLEEDTFSELKILSEMNSYSLEEVEYLMSLINGVYKSETIDDLKFSFVEDFQTIIEYMKETQGRDAYDLFMELKDILEGGRLKSYVSSVAQSFFSEYLNLYTRLGTKIPDKVILEYGYIWDLINSKYLDYLRVNAEFLFLMNEVLQKCNVFKYKMTSLDKDEDAKLNEVRRSYLEYKEVYNKLETLILYSETNANKNNTYGGLAGLLEESAGYLYELDKSTFDILKEDRKEESAVIALGNVCSNSFDLTSKDKIILLNFKDEPYSCSFEELQRVEFLFTLDNKYYRFKYED